MRQPVAQPSRTRDKLRLPGVVVQGTTTIDGGNAMMVRLAPQDVCKILADDVRNLEAEERHPGSP
ncbi:hypothetical protein [Arthrobacter sp. MAHUQ-56]|uniref:hypothetical protein n=1 Tax=Arthrobacter sp. MAHUQ-56 TaxID=2867411 RepID=UPI001C844DE5|nr:hypothetical protein [Arthrobacter sp. MAHUQ-56]